MLKEIKNSKELFLSRLYSAIEELNLSKSEFRNAIHKKAVPRCDFVLEKIHEDKFNPLFLFALDNTPDLRLLYLPGQIDALILDHLREKGFTDADILNLYQLANGYDYTDLKEEELEDPKRLREILVANAEEFSPDLAQKLKALTPLEVYLLFKHLMRFWNKAKGI